MSENRLKEKIKLIFTRHWFVLAFALVTAMIYLLPTFLYSVRSDYRGIVFAPHDAELHYLAMVKEASEGRTSYASPYLNEYKEIRIFNFEFSENVIGSFLRLSGIELSTFFLFSKFVFVFLNFIFFYFFIFQLFNNRLASLFFSLSFFLAYQFLGLFSFGSFASFFSGEGTELLLYDRFVNPLLSYPLFVLSLIFLVRFFKNTNTTNAIWVALTIGLSFYSYLFFWTYLLVIASFVSFFFLLKKDYISFRKAVLALSGAILIGSYYLFLFFDIAFSGIYEKMSEGTLTMYKLSRSPVLPDLVIVAIVILLIVFWYKKRNRVELDKGDYFLFFMALSSLVVVNQHVITGKLVQEGHYHWYINRFVFLASLSYFLIVFFEKKIIDKKLRVFIVLLFIFLIGSGLFIQISAYQRQADLFAREQRYAGIINWLRKKEESNLVIFGNDKVSHLVAAYTDYDVYYDHYAIFYPNIPLERRLHSASLYYYLLYGKEYNEQNFCLKVRQYAYYDYYHDKTDVCIGLPLAGIRKYYDDFVKNDFASIVKKYKADYLVWDKEQEPEWKMDRYQFLNEVFRDNDVIIYSID